MAAPRSSAVRRTGQVLTGFGALVVLCAVLAGGPIALLAFAGNPLPDHLPTLAELGTALTSRDDGQLFLRVLAVVGWFGWATFAFSVLVELLAAALRRPAPRLPGMSRQQRAAAALVGSVALILAASPAAASAATLAAPHPAAAPAVGATAVGSTVVAAPAVRVAASPVQAGSVPLQAEPVSAVADPAVYRVAKGDYLGEVAERYLDDFERYREVARLNRLADPDRIRPGQLLKLPEGAVDDGARRHATGRLVGTPPAHPVPAPRTPATRPAVPGGAGTTTPGVTAPDTTAPGKTTPGATTPGTTGIAAPGRGVEAMGPAPTVKPSLRSPSPRPPSQASTPRPSAQTTTPMPSSQVTGAPRPAAVVEPAGQPPALAAGASRPTVEDRINRPLAISAVLAVASIVGAQIGAVLGLRRRPTPEALPTGRHRKP
ncbi:LysM peptidoglycan-binding domain-containing protein [Micromonospora eburnea]|uniref:LysM domain-containing protein n=1 Tax=Micromonospora eburnea TaxID=227316 RepID=A0A1C6TQK5_9ACTN|nr:LysM peptidoglycan-binding domain-containing protein [Micromonospora eburnea]SCL44102.1 LysM domain-containing protein [Micromonospora eburnea]